MSIVTDALNRLQAERARPIHPPQASAAPMPSGPIESSKPNFIPPQPPSKTIRNILRWSLIIVGVVAVGIGAYLWGLTLMPEVAKVSPEHDTRPEMVKELDPVENEASQVVETMPEPTQGEEATKTFTATMVDSTGDSDSIGTASITGVAPNTNVNESPQPPLQQIASLEVPQPKVSEKPIISSGQGKLPLPAKVTPKNSQVAPPEPRPSQTVSPSETQPSATNSNVKSPKPSKPPVPSSTRTMTPTEAKMAQAKYLIKKQRYRQAVTILQPLFVRPPEAWEPWFWLGTAQLGLEQFAKAEESFLEGLSRNAAIPQLWVQRALVSQQRGLFGEAVEALRQAELIAPGLPEVQLNLAYSLEAQGQITRAVEHYHTFLAITEGKKIYQPARKKVLDRIIRLEKA